MALGRAFLSDATTSGPIVIFGTKWPSITSTCSTVPPPSSAAFASSARRAKFAERIDGASSTVMGGGPLLRFPEKPDYTRNFLSVSVKSAIGRQFACPAELCASHYSRTPSALRGGHRPKCKHPQNKRIATAL